LFLSQNKINVQFPELDKTIIPWLGKTAKMMGLFMGEKLKQHPADLTRKQWLLLKILYDQDGQVQSDLALITDRDKGSLTRLINTLEKKSLVVRIPSPEDRRVNQVFLTEQGKTLLETTVPTIQKAIDEMENGISEAEKKLVIDTLRKVQHNIESVH
jgi:DNA-binding MarR family transcriptional regulator